MKSFFKPAKFSYRTFLLAIPLTFFLNLNAQTLTADDLVKCINFDLNKFDTYVTAKGYSFESITLFGAYSYKSMSANKSISFLDKPMNDFTKQLFYQTLDSENYSSMKTRFVQLGYKLDVTKLSTNLAFYYVKGKHWIELTSQQGSKKTIYTVTFQILK